MNSDKTLQELQWDLRKAEMDLDNMYRVRKQLDAKVKFYEEKVVRLKQVYDKAWTEQTFKGV